MDRLIGLLWLRWTLEVRALSRARGAMLGLAVLLPGLLLTAGAGSLLVFFGLPRLEASRPEWVLPLLSGVTTMIGFSWALSPLLAGIALTETHDVTRLLQFPLRPRLLVLSSFLSNLAQPSMFAAVPIAVSTALSLASPPIRLPLTALGVALNLLFLLATAQAAGLVLQGLGRNRRWHDMALFVGLGLGFLMSLAPALLIAGGGRTIGLLARLLVHHDVLAVSPFSWGVRAAVYASRGSLVGFVGYAAAEALGVAAMVALSAALIERIHRSEVIIAPATGKARPARMLLPGSLGALIEKDLRSGWRDPATRASFFLGLLGPLVLLVLLSRGIPSVSGTPLLLLATLVGLSPFGANAFGLERRGIGLLMSFPIARWKILLGKNVGAMLLRAPGLVMILAAGTVIAPVQFLPAAAVIALLALTVSAGADNFLSILAPVPVPAPGANPYAPVSGGRGLGTLVLSMLLFGVTAAVSAPLVFLAWLPALLDRPELWLVLLPAALAGAAAVYAMLLLGAERLLRSREPELLERVLTEV